jgi:flagellar biosynthesis GTPase FlhF
MQADYQQFWRLVLPDARQCAPEISTRLGVLRRTLRRIAGQTIVLAFVVLDIGGLGFAVAASDWLAPWVTVNVAAVVLAALSWSEDRRIRREGATATQRQVDKVCEAHMKERAECLRQAEQLRESERRRRHQQEEREAQRRLQAALRQTQEQLREAKQRRRQEEEERETQRQRQTEQAERVRQAEQQRREAERRRRQAEEERQARRERQQERKRAAAQSEIDWWTVLGVAPSASKDDIVREYRSKIKRCHPDRLLGLGPELLQLAEEQTKALNGAYANALRTRRSALARP